jgi:hypothetical protein
VTLISRLRLDVALYEEPPAVPKGKRGRKPVKGKRIMLLKEQVNLPESEWSTETVRWYGGVNKTVRYRTGCHLWYKAGCKPLPVRWVLVINPDNPSRPEAFFSTDTELEAKQIIGWFILRWNIEVTFEEVRAHLGVETQRQWSDRAIGRTTPILMGLYSVACLIGLRLINTPFWRPTATAWYCKDGKATFSDVIAAVRRSIWASRYFSDSAKGGEATKLAIDQSNFLIDLLAEAA